MDGGLLPSRLRVQRAGNRRLPSKTRIARLRQTQTTLAIRTSAPRICLRQDLLARPAQYIAGRLFQALQQRLIRPDDAELRVVRQNHIEDGIEGVRPLLLRACHLLLQPQILHRHSQLPRRRFQKLQFFPPVPTTVRARQRQHSDRRLFSLYRQQHHMMNTVLPQLPPLHLRHLREFHHHRSVFAENTCLGFTRPSLPKGAQKFSRQAGVLRGHHALADHPLEPRRFRSHHRLQSFQRGLHHGRMILAARNGDAQPVQHRQPARAQPQVLQHHHQQARPKHRLRQ